MEPGVNHPKRLRLVSVRGVAGRLSRVEGSDDDGAARLGVALLGLAAARGDGLHDRCARGVPRRCLHSM